MRFGAVRLGAVLISAAVAGPAAAAESVIETLSTAPRPVTPSPNLAAANLVVCAHAAGVPTGDASAAVPGATVILISPDGKVFSATGGSDGCAGFLALGAGTYRVTVASPTAEPVDGTVDVPASGQARFDAALPLLSAEGEEVVVVEASREGAGETRHTIKPREVRNIPGAANDALKSVQNLPGVARPPFGAGMLVVRGSAPGDTRVFLDGQEIPQLYHFSGLNSVVPTEMLSRIDFLPGGFGVRYGRAVGGVVDVESRGGREDKWGGFFDADFYGAAGLAEGPVGNGAEKGHLIGGVRRSYVDFVLPALAGSSAGGGADLDWTVAPRYYDYQLRYDPRPAS
jgi:outer membrane receptor protein involved in Fe transport